MRAEPGPPRSVFILKPSSFGDIIHTLPAVARLKTAWPETRFAWMVNPEWVPLLEGNPDLDEIVVFPRREFRGLSGLRRLFHWQRCNVRGRQSDLALDFQGLLRTAIVGRLSRPHAFYGMPDAREGATWFYDQAAPIPAGTVHSVTRYLSLSEFALRRYGNMNPGDSETLPVRFALPLGEPPNSPELEGLEKHYVLLHPFSRGPGNRCPPGRLRNFVACFLPARSSWWAAEAAERNPRHREP